MREEFSLSFCVHALRNRWRIAVTVFALAIVSAVFFTSRQSPVYRSASMTTVVVADELTQPSDVVRALEALDRRTVVATFAQIAEAQQTRHAVAVRLGLPLGELDLYRFQASVLPNTNIIRIGVEGPDPILASTLANAASRVLASEAHAIYNIYNLRPLQTAAPASRPSYPHPTRNYFIAGILGLLLGLAAAIGVEYVSLYAPRSPARQAIHH